jgi:hypothetical protein
LKDSNNEFFRGIPLYFPHELIINFKEVIGKEKALRGDALILCFGRSNGKRQNNSALPAKRKRYFMIYLIHSFSFPIRETTPFPVLPSTLL